MKIKVCGLQTPADVAACLSARVDWVGLNFHPTSVRKVSIEQARELRAAVQGHAETVGLFVDRPVAEVLKTAETVGLDFIQLHGMELVDQLLKYQKYRVIKAFRIGGADSIASMQAYLAEADKLGCPPYAVLVDAYVPGHVGGTGVTIVDEVLRQIPAHPRMILAGGLTPLNVVDRLRLIQPWMVDVASGVESAPGQKCPDRIQAFVDVVRSR